MMGNGFSVRAGRESAFTKEETKEEEQGLPTVTSWTIQAVGDPNFAGKVMKTVDVRNNAVSPGQLIDKVWHQAGGGEKVNVGVRMDTKSQRMIVQCSVDK